MEDWMIEELEHEAILKEEQKDAITNDELCEVGVTPAKINPYTGEIIGGGY